MTAATRIQSVLATDDHVEAIAAFYGEAWGQATTAEAVLAARRRLAIGNVAAPGEAPPIALVFHGSRIVGYCESIPNRLWDGVAEHPAYWVKGLMVLPEYRGGPIGFLVVKELAGRLPRSTLLAVAPAALRLFGAVGYTDLGAVPNLVRPLRPARIARSLDIRALGVGGLPGWVSTGVRLMQRTGVATLGGAVAGAALHVAATTTRRGLRGIVTEHASEVPSRQELDELWSRARSGLAASPVRDGLYLGSRFAGDTAAEKARSYGFVTAREGTRLAGVAVVRRPSEVGDPRLRGLRIATLSDIVFPPERVDIGLGLLGGVERAARAADGDAILCSTSHRTLRRLLRRQSYLPLPGNLHFFLRDTTNTTRWPQDLSSWWLARGDGAADEVF